MRNLLLLALVSVSFSQKAFESMEGVVGYIVIEKHGKTENYVVVEEKDGKVKTIRVEQSPSQFLKKTEEGGKK
ncbi:MAG: hypothetical protein ACPLRS_03275 [Hydrogenobacter sp.]|uniref:Uncharacterized protein n=1 Tax=Hydrogenobacter hydrogenophilus TaxID=35835 RepID=A0A285P543_9AQUI|nr:hypothetical protein [Hydrogenobacter hydrogenophilus]SNZ14991.1 hypothetical protein SAMN06265353_1248 [Hydrogenobacter hydrogenophilus]